MFRKILEDQMSQKIENAAVWNELINVEELEQKLAPSASWEIVEP